VRTPWLFDQYGIQKTTVEDIARAAKISKGSFYSFFNSKEELFFDILENIEREFKGKFYEEVFPESKSRREGFKAFLNDFFDIMQNTSLFKKLNSSDIEYLMRKLPENRLAGHIQHDYAVFEDFYCTWRDKGVFKELNIKGFTGVMKLMFYLILHQTEYTNEEFEATKDIFVDMICEYIVPE